MGPREPGRRRVAGDGNGGRHRRKKADGFAIVAASSYTSTTGMRPLRSAPLP